MEEAAKADQAAETVESINSKIDKNAESVFWSGDTTQKLTLIRLSADSFKKSADALNDSSLWEKKKITKTDEETGEKVEVEDYDWNVITKAVKSFVENYNSVVDEAGDSNTKNVLRNAAWMTDITDKNSNMLARIGITIGKDNKLELGRRDSYENTPNAFL